MVTDAGFPFHTRAYSLGLGCLKKNLKKIGCCFSHSQRIGCQPEKTILKADSSQYLRKKRGAGGRGEATTGEPVLSRPLRGMLYADDAGVVSQSPEQLRKMRGVTVVVCAAFGLTVSEAKTEIMCLRAKGMPEATVIFSVEAAGQVYNQTNEFVYLGGDVNHNADLSIEVDRRIRNAWCSFRK